MMSTGDNETDGRKLRGRPRSLSTKRKILHATMKLLETENLQDLTIESIAQKAHVSKATIYRWWPSKAAVVIDAFLEYHVIKTPISEDLSSTQALLKLFNMIVDEYRSPTGQILAQIIAAGQFDEVTKKTFSKRFTSVRTQAVLEIINKGIERGELRSDIPVHTIAECLFAPIYRRLLIGDLPLDNAFAESHAKTLIPLFEPQNDS